MYLFIYLFVSLLIDFLLIYLLFFHIYVHVNFLKYIYIYVYMYITYVYTYTPGLMHVTCILWMFTNSNGRHVFSDCHYPCGPSSAQRLGCCVAGMATVSRVSGCSAVWKAHRMKAPGASFQSVVGASQPSDCTCHGPSFPQYPHWTWLSDMFQSKGSS